MTLIDFNLLPKNKKIALLQEQGVYIGKIKHGTKTSILFQFGSFYVEIFYKRYRYYIDHINCFSSTDQLNPYLDQVNVAELVKWSN